VVLFARERPVPVDGAEGPAAGTILTVPGPDGRSGRPGAPGRAACVAGALPRVLAAGRVPPGDGRGRPAELAGVVAVRAVASRAAETAPRGASRRIPAAAAARPLAPCARMEGDATPGSRRGETPAGPGVLEPTAPLIRRRAAPTAPPAGAPSAPAANPALRPSETTPSTPALRNRAFAARTRPAPAAAGPGAATDGARMAWEVKAPEARAMIMNGSRAASANVISPANAAAT